VQEVVRDAFEQWCGAREDGRGRFECRSGGGAAFQGYHSRIKWFLVTKQKQQKVVEQTCRAQGHLGAWCRVVGRWGKFRSRNGDGVRYGARSSAGVAGFEHGNGGVGERWWRVRVREQW
jgi:hypothetical protein